MSKTVLTEEMLEALVPYVAAAVAPVERFGTEEHFYGELERLAAAFSAACDGLDTGDVVSHVVEIIRDLAWALDELTGTDETSRVLIEQGNFRTWSIESDGARHV